VIINEAVLARLCNLAYQPLASYADTPMFQIGTFKAFQRSGAECIVVSGPNATIVAVRGTQRESLIDWIYDLQFLFPREVPEGFVHRGFRRCEQRLAKTGLWDYLQKLNPPKLWWTGHSLGGAVATLMAYESIKRGFAPVSLFTIGSPRVANDSWCHSAFACLKVSGGDVLRIVNPMDLVTHLPPYGNLLLPKYRHIGPTTLISEPEGLVLEASVTENLFVTIRNALCHPMKVRVAHNTAEYTRLLETWIDRCQQNGVPPLVTFETG